MAKRHEFTADEVAGLVVFAAVARDHAPELVDSLPDSFRAVILKASGAVERKGTSYSAQQILVRR